MNEDTPERRIRSYQRIRNVNKKCKRKRGIMKKCIDMAEQCGLKVTLIIFDDKMNCIEEFNTSPEFDIKNIHQQLDHREKHWPHLSVRKRRKLVKYKKINFNLES